VHANGSQPQFVWQLLNVESHMHTLKPGNAPLGLLEMITPSPRKILDVGCFCGGSGRWLKSKFPGCEIVGIEMMGSAAAMAAEVYDKVITKTIEQTDFDAEGIVPGTFDAIIAADILEHLYNPWRALQRLKPLLAPGGALYVSLPNVRNLGLISALVGGDWKYAGAGLLDITHIRFFTRTQAVEMLGETGWRVNELQLNPDPILMASLQGQELIQIRSINAGRLKLEDLTQDDVAELFAIQFHIRAVPAGERPATP
jgi:2-polyprenyl-3-methyl-5-hydroxy-6-metoxy-1,4-benzoquinol methylase